jgi:hypothetical protein
VWHSQPGLRLRDLSPESVGRVMDGGQVGDAVREEARPAAADAGHASALLRAGFGDRCG